MKGAFWNRVSQNPRFDIRNTTDQSISAWVSWADSNIIFPLMHRSLNQESLFKYASLNSGMFYLNTLKSFPTLQCHDRSAQIETNSTARRIIHVG